MAEMKISYSMTPPKGWENLTRTQRQDYMERQVMLWDGITEGIRRAMREKKTGAESEA